MANDITGSPWILDTAAAGLVWTGNIYVLFFEFYGYGAIADNAVLQDVNNKAVWTPKGRTDLIPVQSNEIGWVHSLRLTTLSAGKIAVHHGAPRRC